MSSALPDDVKPVNANTGSVAQPVKEPRRRRVASALRDIKDILTSITGIIMVAVPALATLGIGVAVGHSIAPAPATTVTQTPSVVAAPPAAPPPSSTAANPLDGKQLGAYDLTLVSGYSAPIGTNAPTQQQFVVGNGSGDLHSDPNYSLFTVVGTTNKLFKLTDNATPTYAGCKATTIFTGGIPIVTGTTFCLAENGRMVGGTVTATSHVVGGPSTVGIIVWQDS
jgi:hypothetical protein